jgi:hypothetical protein
MRCTSAPPTTVLSLLLVCGLLAACDDGPAGPGVIVHPADGQVWTAVLVPDGVPEARTWLAQVRPQGPDSEAALRQIRDLRGEAERARRAGDLETARLREDDAALLAARSLTQMPPTPVLLAGLGALDIWSDRASRPLEGEGFDELRTTVADVRAHRRRAASAMQNGDTLTAVLALTEASRLVNSYAPDLVAARLLARAETRLREHSASHPDAARALRLLRNSREALATGDDERAIRRAFYALQLADQLTSNRAALPPPAGPAQ